MRTESSGIGQGYPGAAQDEEHEAHHVQVGEKPDGARSGVNHSGQGYGRLASDVPLVPHWPEDTSPPEDWNRVLVIIVGYLMAHEHLAALKILDQVVTPATSSKMIPGQGRFHRVLGFRISVRIDARVIESVHPCRKLELFTPVVEPTSSLPSVD